MKRSIRRSAVVVLLTLALVSGMVTSVAAQTHDIESNGSSLFAQQSAPENTTKENSSAANNSTVRHVNPNSRENEQTTEELQAVLASRLANRLDESAVQISEEQQDRAQQLLGDEYLETLEKYAEIKEEQGETDAVRDFEQARSSQENFSKSAQEFNNTLEEYRDAKQREDEDEAQRLAHRLNDLAEQTNQSSNQLNKTYSNLSQETDQNFSTTQKQIADVEEDISTTRDEIVAAELYTTVLTLSSDQPDASFLSPMAIEGQLTTTNGNAVSEQAITVAVGNRYYEVQTDDSGRFSLGYRPTTLSAAASTVTVQYIPDESAPYTASDGTLPIEITQLNATVNVANSTKRAAYNEPVMAQGTLSIEGESISNYPVSLTLDGQTLVSSTTDSDGSFSTNSSLPASIPPGERSLRLTGNQTNSAVVVSTDITDVTIESTPTNLTLSVQANGSQIVTTGQLTAGDEQEVADQRIQVSVSGETKRVRTNGEGYYKAQFIQQDFEGRTTVDSRFDGSESNLESSNVSTQLTTGPTEGTSDGNLSGGIGVGVDSEPIVGNSGEESNDFLATLFGWFITDGSKTLGIGGGSSSYLLLGIVMIALAIAGFAVYRFQSVSGIKSSDSEQNSESEEIEQTIDDVYRADEYLERGELEEAVRVAYRSVQTTVMPLLDGSLQGKTHRQFYRACQDSNTVSNDELDTLVNTYELAVYSNSIDDNGKVREAINAAKDLIQEIHGR